MTDWGTHESPLQSLCSAFRRPCFARGPQLPAATAAICVTACSVQSSKDRQAITVSESNNT